jgi:hypothetical protein
VKAIECGREQELIDALTSARWPERCGADLRTHVASCGACADTLAVALPLLTDGEAAYGSARVPSSGIVWWRAQMRARQEAARAASRPITVVQAVAFACGAALVVTATSWALPLAQGWGNWARALAGAAAADAPALSSLQSLAPSGLLPWIVLGVWIALAPIAIYLAVADD